MNMISGLNVLSNIQQDLNTRHMHTAVDTIRMHILWHDIIILLIRSHSLN